MNKIKELYGKLPKEAIVAIEYLIPSYLITVFIEQLASLETNSFILNILVNIALIFLRQIKPRFEKMKK